MKNNKIIKLSILASAISSSLTMAEPSDQKIDALLEKAQYWYEQGDIEVSRKTWNKILLIQPGNSEAVNSLAELTSLKDYSIDERKLKFARSLAKEGRYEDSILAYKTAFKGLPRTSHHSVEYYETLSGLESGWPEAVKALKSLSEKHPSYSRYKLALAKVLTYREGSRRDGIASLKELSSSSALSAIQKSDAKSALRQALLWLHAKEQDRHLFSSYLDDNPEDELIKSSLENLNTLESSEIGDAYVLLKKNSLSKAEEMFKKVLKEQPENADALGGLGIIEMRRKNFSKASRLMGDASQKSAAVRDALRVPLRDSNYWSLVRRADAAARRNQSARAISLAKKAQKIHKNRIEPQLILASIAKENGKHDDALGYYTAVLEKKPSNPEARAGLINLYIEVGDEASALESIEKFELPKSEFQKSLDGLKVTRLRREAREMLDDDYARDLLEQALMLDPKNEWVRLDLARAYDRSGRPDEAVALFDNLLRRNPENSPGNYARALFHEEREEWSASIDALNQIPYEQLTEEQQAFQKHLSANVEKERAMTAIVEGQLDEAKTIAQHLKWQGDAFEAETQLPYAEVLAELGDVREALRIGRRLIDPINNPGLDTRIRYAGLLLKTGKREELVHLLDRIDLHRLAYLTPLQAKAIQDLRLGLALQQADVLRANKKFDQALDILRPQQIKYENSTQIRTLQAAIYMESGAPTRALSEYLKLIKDGQLAEGNYSAAADAALSLNRYKLVEKLIDEGLDATPQSMRLLALRSRMKLMRGENLAAGTDLDSALRLSSIDIDSAKGGGGADFNSGSTIADHYLRMKPSLKQAQSQFYRVNDNRRTTINAANGIKNRGKDGLDAVTEFVFPLQFQYQKNLDNAFGVDIKLLTLDGEDSLESVRKKDLQFDTAFFGGLPIFLAQPNERLEMDADGIAFGINYQGKNWRADVGSTPSSFPVSNIVGGVGWDHKSYSSEISADFSRRALKESILAYAGAEDPQFGSSWGGVTRSGLDFTANRSFSDKLGVYGNVGAFSLDGENVASNNETIFGMGGYWQVLKQEARQVNVGLSLRYRKFDENLRFFTLGHGGYFSPQRYLSLSVPTTLTGRKGKLNYRLSGEVGVYNFEENSSEVFPDDAGLQGDWEILSRSRNGLEAQYEGRDESSVLYNLKGEANYLLHKQFSLGGWLSVDNADNYEEFSTGISLRYFFSPRNRQTAGFFNSNDVLLSNKFW